MTTSHAVHSQAFGFMSYVQGGVDPRTGQYTVSINLPEVKSNWLCGPAFPLSLTFNPINTLDSGFGVGWNLNLTQFTPHNSILALSTGETFKVTGSGTVPGIKEKKLDSFHFENLGDDRYRVLHKSGMIEELQVGGSNNDRVALPVEIKSPAGHGLTLTYASFRGGQRLQSISDAQGELLRINRQTNDQWVEILVRPYDGAGGVPLARYEMKLNASGWVTEIVLPTPDKGSWRFGYGSAPIRGILCLHEVKTPSGGRETIEYTDTGHPYPGGVTRANLPRVTRHRSYPGFEQPMIEVGFSYTAHNFLGAGESVSWEDGMDPLYKLSASYDYVSTASLMVGDQVVRQVERTFNRFHLLTEEKTTQDNCVKRVKTEYYAKDVPFEQQVAQFQLPQQVISSWEIANDATQYRAEITLSAYDEYGNQTEQVEPNGIKTVHTYYPKAGDDGCPPDRFVRNLKDTTVIPSTEGEAGAPTLRTRLRYTAHKPLAGSVLEDWLAIDSETLVQVVGTNETQLQQTQHSYNEFPDDAFLHGRPVSQQITLNGRTSTTSYEYELLSSALAGETVLQTTETYIGHDDKPGSEVRKTIISEDSLLHGQPLLTRDDNEVKIRYTYDALTRVVTETVAPGEPEFEATRHYSYTLTALDGQQAEQVVTDVKGVKTRTRVDGLNRAVYEERLDADNPLRAEEYRQTYSARYDALENLIEETQYDWRGTQQLVLTTTFEYDAWAMQRCVTGPDGVKAHEETNPIGSAQWKGPIQTSWREGTGAGAKVSGRTVTYLNLLEKPDHVERFETDETLIGRHRYGYDGLGRTVKETDARDAITQYSYDAFDRMVTNILPGGATVRRSYALHSSEDLPTEISVDGTVLGQQVFDGLGRMAQSITGGRKQSFTYDPGQTQPATTTTASNQLISYVYEPQLGEEPSQRRLPGDITAEYVRDRKNARLVSCKEEGLELSRDYFTTGDLKTETRVQGGSSYAMHYDYSRLGLLLNYTDVLEQTQTYTYDKANRLEQTRLGATSSDFTFDNLGQLSSISTGDSASGQSVTISLQYDGMGRETQRTFDLDGVEQTLTQVYNGVDALTERTLRQGESLLRKETYEYDPRGRLVLYTCEGSQPPVDPYGKTIISQLFRFDAMDNLTRVTTTSPEGANVAVYTYDTTDPTQLRKVTNTGVAGYPAEILLEYDADGHMTQDEEGRLLDYDALGRLIQVSALPGETPSGYRYDPLDTLAGLDNGGGQEQRFYQNGELANQVHGAGNSTFMRGGGVVLAEHQAGADPKSLLLAFDHKNTVLGEVGEASVNVAYSAYGHPSAEQQVNTHFGYNGEYSERQTGWQLLGNGYRAYNPVLMRFHSPDSWSPFGDGGVNAYMYCGGDPISNVDPDGHSWLSALWNRRPTWFWKSPVKAASKPQTKSTVEKVKDFKEATYERNREVLNQLSKDKPKPVKIKKAFESRQVMKEKKLPHLKSEISNEAQKTADTMSILDSAVNDRFYRAGGLRPVKKVKASRVVNNDVRKNIKTIETDILF